MLIHVLRTVSAVSSCSHPSPNNRKSYVRSPSVLCVGRRSHFVRRLSLSLFPARSFGLVCYVFVFDQRFIPKPKSSFGRMTRLPRTRWTATERARTGLTRLCTKFEIYLVGFDFDSMLFFPLFHNLHNASLAKDGYDANCQLD